MKKVLMILMLAMAPMALAKTAQSCGYKNGKNFTCNGKTYPNKDFIIIATNANTPTEATMNQLNKLQKSARGKKLVCRCPKKLIPGATRYSIYKK